VNSDKRVRRVERMTICYDISSPLPLVTPMRELSKRERDTRKTQELEQT
jgi:hypothetical protein